MSERLKTSLGIWAFGPMVTRFVPGGYQPERAGETTVERVREAVEGLGDLIDGYEFHYPQELIGGQPRRGARRARRPRHLLHGDRAPPRPALRQGRARLARRRRRAPRPCKRTLDAIDFAGELGAHFIIWPGIEGYNYPFQTPYAESWAWFIDGIGQAAQRCARPRDQALPRAQELRAGDEDPHAQHRA